MSALNVTGSILEEIVAYFNFHFDDETVKSEEELKKFDLEFISRAKSQDTLFEILMVRCKLSGPVMVLATPGQRTQVYE